MVNKAAFLDRDGTINVDFGYIGTAERWEFAPKAVEAIRYLNEHGYLVIVVTNQSGIARGYFKIADVDRLHAYVAEELKKQGAHIDGIYMCPHHKDGIVPEFTRDCTCRKPNIELYKRAVKDFGIDVSRSIACGDKPSDTKAAVAMGIGTVGEIGLNCESLYNFVMKACHEEIF